MNSPPLQSLLLLAALGWPLLTALALTIASTRAAVMRATPVAAVPSWGEVSKRPRHRGCALIDARRFPGYGPSPENGETLNDSPDRTAAWLQQANVEVERLIRRGFRGPEGCRVRVQVLGGAGFRDLLDQLRQGPVVWNLAADDNPSDCEQPLIEP